MVELTPDDVLPLELAAASDHHTVIVPTHVVKRDGEIIGYGSIGTVPMLNVWVHSTKVNKFESLRLLREAEAIAKAQGAAYVIMPVSEESPFRPYVARMGYTTLGSASYNLKKL